MKRVVLVAILLAVFMVPVVSGRSEVNITAVLQDGFIDNAWLRTNNTDLIWQDVTHRGYAEFNISEIPDTAIIDRVDIIYTARTQIAGQIQFRNMSIWNRPSLLADNAGNNQWIYDNITGGTNWVTGVTPVVDGTTYVQDLGAKAAADFQGMLAGDWFIVGMVANPAQRINSTESTGDSGPKLQVSWHLAGDLTYEFTGPLFENGNTTTPIWVTAAIEAGNERFLVNGTTLQYYPVEPLIFYWDLGGGTTRRIYSVGEENLTITIPDQDFDTYTFTVRDFTNKLARGDAFLEAWRIVDANDTLIERQIIDVHNEVPLNLVVGATYTLTIRYYDNSTTDWGFFVPGSTTTNTIVLRGVEITDQAYLVGNFISVEITRPITTQITVDYLTSQNTTIWSNVTVRIRNGAIVAFRSNVNESYVFNVGGLTATESYVVVVNGEHTLQTEWGYSRTFDGEETYPDFPNVETIFPMGDLDAYNMLGWVFTLATGITWSIIDKRTSLIAMCAIGSFFTAFGFTDWNTYLLSVCWFFAVIVYLGSGER